MSVTFLDQDYTGWKSWKHAIHLVPGEHGEILGRLEVGWVKIGALAHKNGNIAETGEDRGKVTIECL